MSESKQVPPHICPRCGGHMLASVKPVQWSAKFRGFEHIACAAVVSHAA